MPFPVQAFLVDGDVDKLMAVFSGEVRSSWLIDWLVGWLGFRVWLALAVFFSEQDLFLGRRSD